MQAGTKSEMSPPNIAICFTILELKYIFSAEVVRNTVSSSGFSFLLVRDI